MVLASAVLRFAGWSFLPDFITSRAVQVMHTTLFPMLKLTPPPPRTPAYVKQYRYVFSVVVLGYLLYNFVEASNGMPANFYEMLGVQPAADDGQLKQAFRGFAKKNHPDRVGPQGELLFVSVRDAYESLKDPVRRFAYDRFGPDALEWANCSTVRDYLYRGLQQSLGFHIASFVFLVAASFIGQPSPVAFWRYLLYFAQFLAEFALILGPSATMSNPSDTSASGSSTLHENILSTLFPRRVAYQHILLLHQIFIVASVAVSRVAPVLFPPSIDEVEGLGVDPRTVQNALEKIAQLGIGIENEVTGHLNEHLMSISPHTYKEKSTVGSATLTGLSKPLRIDDRALDALTREIEALVIEARLANAAAQPGPLQSVFNTALTKARDAADAADTARSSSRPPGPSRMNSERERWDVQENTFVGDSLEEAVGGIGKAKVAILPPSPVSDGVSTPPTTDAKGELAAHKFPSPRPSPTPAEGMAGFVNHPGLGRKESYIRARSISC